MVFTLETGAGTPGANAYTTPTFVTGYLTDRARETENSWSTETVARQEQAIIVATQYIDTRWGAMFRGVKLQERIDGRAATGSITLTLLPSDTETVTVGQITYRFVATVTQPNDVLIGATIAESVENLASVINGGAQAGDITNQFTNRNYEAEATIDETVPDEMVVTAQNSGVSGNEIPFATTAAGALITGTGFLLYGLDDAPQPLQFPRRGLRDYDGQTVIGIPLKLQQATAEYAVRSLDQQLAPDLTTDATGALVQRKMEKVGPIEEETEYAEGAIPRIYRSYPEADSLLAEYITSGAGVVR